MPSKPPEPPPRHWAVRLLAITAWVLYVLFFLPNYIHAEALPIHIGVVGLGVALSRRAPGPWRFTLRTALVGLAISCCLCTGFFRMARAEDDMREHVRRLCYERLGFRGGEDFRDDAWEGLNRDLDLVQRGDATALDEVVLVLKEKRPGWGRAAAVLYRRFIDPEKYTAPLEEPATLRCGIMYATPFGSDTLRRLKVLAHWEAYLTDASAELRNAVLAKVETGEMARRVEEARPVAGPP